MIFAICRRDMTLSRRWSVVLSPQGDPWSLVAMSALLVAPTLASQSIPGVSCVTFVDDRKILANDSHGCLEAAQAWQTWSAILGVREITDKEQYFHKGAARRAQLSELGVAESKITSSPSFLCGTQERSLHDAEHKRIASATTADCGFALLVFTSCLAFFKAAFGWKH